MKVSVVFPSVMYRDGPEAVGKLIRGFEQIGFDELDMFDHVVMGYPTDTRTKPFYSPKMPIVEAFMLLAFAAAHTKTIGLGTSVLVLPQRHPTLVAKQVSTLDTLSGGRVRLGVGTGWQASEYEAQGEQFTDRGQRMDECIDILRAYWSDEHVNYHGKHYQIDEMAMEPKPPQGGKIPIWIGGTKSPALRRVARMGDGWMAMNAPGDKPIEARLAELRQYAEEYGRDLASVGLQMSLSPSPLDKEKRKRFFADPNLLLDRTIELKELGFQQTSIDCVPIFQQGHRTVDALLDYLREVYEKLSPELE
ncbi:MAG: TIGR03619 family F420-dependent LLM class oxidoreductase [Pseudomonadales bacterium]